MEYKKDFKIKPYRVNESGVVEFTDGTTNTLLANELTCKAYGYKYDKEKGVCRAYTPNRKVSELLIRNDSVKGFGDNITKGISSNSLAVGNNHKLSQNKNCLVVGTNHEITSRITDASITGGTLGKPVNSGEVLHAGGQGDGGLVGQIGTRHLHLSATHVSGSDFNLYIQGDLTKQEEITLPKNSVNIYEIFISGICIGGSSGTIGDYQSRRYTGAVRVDRNGNLAHVAEVNSNVSTIGTTGTISFVTSTDYTFKILIAESSNVHTTWSASVKIYQNQLTKAEFAH
tara:strand:+ start:13855 stop:14712 length:858 start_codon:yes stop_codon:yes gene_type:complete